MARKPSYPDDAAVGSAAGAASDQSGDESKETAESGGDPRRRKHLMTGAAIGIGSAALVAALLYANRGKKG